MKASGRNYKTAKNGLQGGWAAIRMGRKSYIRWIKGPNVGFRVARHAEISAGPEQAVLFLHKGFPGQKTIDSNGCFCNNFRSFSFVDELGKVPDDSKTQTVFFS